MAQQIGPLIASIKFVADYKQANKAAQKFTKSMKNTDAQMKRLEKTLNSAEQKKIDMIRSIERSSASMGKQRKMIGQVEDAYDNLSSAEDDIKKNTLDATRAQIEFENSLRETKRGIQDSNKAQSEQTKRAKESQQISRQVTKNLNRLNQQRQDAIRSIQKSTLSHDEQEKAIGRVNKAFGIYQRNQVEAAKGTRRGVKAQNAFNNTLNETKRGLKDHADMTREMNKENDKTNPILGRMIKNFNKLAGKMRVMAFTVGTLSAAVISLASELEAMGAIAAGVLVDIQFDTARQRLQSLNETVEATQMQLSVFTDIAANAGVRITAVTEGMADFSAAARSAGLSLDQTNSILNAFTQAQSDFGGTSDEVNKTLEDLAGLAKQSTVTMEDLRDSVEFTNDPLKVLSNSFNTSEREIRKMIESGDELTTQSLLPLARQLENQTEASDGLAASFNRLVATVTEVVRRFNRMGVIDSIINQMNRLRDFLETPAGAGLITDLAEGATQLINQTLPNLVNSIRNNWDTIRKTIKGVVGFLIGSAVGGAPGGLIGALIGATENGAEAFGVLADVIKGAVNSFKEISVVLSGFIGLGLTKYLIDAAGAFGRFRGRISAAAASGTRFAGSMVALRGALGVLTGPAGLILAAGSALAYLWSQADSASDSTETLSGRLKEAADQAERMQKNSRDVLLQDASDAIDRHRKKIKELKEEMEGMSDNPNRPGRSKQDVQDRIKRLQGLIKELEENRKQFKKYSDESKKFESQNNEASDAVNGLGESLENLRTKGDPFADQVKGIESFTDRVDDLKQSISDIRARLSGGNVPEDLRKFTQDLEGMNRQSLKDVGKEMDLFGGSLSPQALGSREQMIRAITQAVKELLNTQQREETKLFMKDETERLRRQTAAYKAGEDAIKRYNIRKQIAAKTGQKFAEVESEQITRLKQEKEAAEDAKEEYQRFQQMKQQLGDAVGDSLTDAVVSANSLSEALNDLGKQIARIIMQKGVSEPLANAVSTGIGNMFSNNTTTSSTGVAANVPKNAKGGIVNRTSAMMTTSGVQTMSENNKSEAILPLERQNGMLGVRSTGGESAAPIINIYNEGGEEAEVEESTDGSGRSVIDIIIPAVQSGIQQGKLDKSMTNRFQGLQPRVKGR